MVTFSSSTSAPSLCSALAIADSSTFLNSSAAFLLLNASRLSARSTGSPRTWSATRRPFCAELRAYLNVAAVHRERQADHLRQHRGTARPGLDGLAAVGGHRLLHLFEEVKIDEGTFFN